MRNPDGNELLEFAVRAHGGMERWHQVNQAVVEASITGSLWPSKGQNGLLANVILTADLHRQRLVTDFVGQDKRTIFESDRVTLTDQAGKLIKVRDQPKAAFADHEANTIWDELHSAYFNGAAFWTCITVPFLYASPGFVCEELPRWHEDGEEWRPLRVHFPDWIATYGEEQVSYFGPDGLLRRHEYTADVLGGARGLNYAYDYHEADGIKVPFTRRVYGGDAMKRKISQPLLVAIDIRMIQFL